MKPEKTGTPGPETPLSRAVAADLAYDAAIKKQFGRRASRWDHPSTLYNAETRKAFAAKVKADEENMAAMRAAREAAQQITPTTKKDQR